MFVAFVSVYNFVWRSPILYYSITYLPRRGQEQVDRTSGTETFLTLKNLRALDEISFVKVCAITKVQFILPPRSLL
jgi:hypothetical protein